MHLQLDLLLEDSAAVRALELLRLFVSTSSTGPDLLGRSDALFTAFAASHLFEGDKLIAAGTDAGVVVPTELLQVWSLTQLYSVDFSQSRIDVNKCGFYKRTNKVCVSCC